MDSLEDLTTAAQWYTILALPVAFFCTSIMQFVFGGRELTLNV